MPRDPRSANRSRGDDPLSLHQPVDPHTPVALVLAAGTGSRVGADRPKQLLELLGRPVVIHALEQHHRMGHHVVVVVSDGTKGPIVEMIDEHLPDADIQIAMGGDTRRASVIAGVEAIPDETDPTTGVILRNAASPNTPDSLIEGCLESVKQHDGVQAFVRSNETTFIRANDNLDWLIARDITGFTADPTVYRRELMESVAQEMRVGDLGETTLDIARRLHANIGLVESPRSNFKLTTAGDLHRLEVAMTDPAAYD